MGKSLAICKIGEDKGMVLVGDSIEKPLTVVSENSMDYYLHRSTVYVNG